MIPYDFPYGEESSQLVNDRKVMEASGLAPLFDETKVFYLGTPYTRYGLGLDKAYEHAAILSSNLLRLGINVFSPIVHSHSMSSQGLIPHIFPLWLRLDEKFITKLDGMIVAHMPGSLSSYGVKFEVNKHLRLNKPVFSLDTKSTLKTSNYFTATLREEHQ